METNKKKNLKRIECVVTDEMVLDYISLVARPAIRESFIALSDTLVQKKIELSLDEEKMLITGPALIPDMDIYRCDKDTGEEWYVYFSKETVRKIGRNLIKAGKLRAVNLEHKTPIDSAFVEEFWFVEDSNIDRSALLGMDLPVGTMMITYNLSEDPELWNDVKRKVYTGYSIQGDVLELVFAEHKNEKPEMKRNTSIYKKIKEALGLLKFNEDTLADGTMIATDGEFVVGAQVNVVAADGSQNPIPDGSYTLSDGTIITVMAGVITEVATAEEEAADAEMAAKPAATEAQAPAATEGQDLQAQVDALKAELDAIKSALGLKEQELATAHETLATLSAEKSELEKKVVELSEQPGAETIQKTALAKQIELSKQNENSRLEQFRRLRAAQK